MKTKKLVFAGLMVSFLALSVMGRNNFDIGWSVLDDEAKMYSEKEVVELVNRQLIVPIKKCYTEANPDAFMTKCYSEMKFEFDKQYDWMKSDDKELQFHENQTILGEAVYIDCGTKRHIGQLQIRMDTKQIKVQESFFSGWVEAGEFTDSFCKKVVEE